jgi:hypothetical protein
MRPHTAGMTCMRPTAPALLTGIFVMSWRVSARAVAHMSGAGTSNMRPAAASASASGWPVSDHAAKSGSNGLNAHSTYFACCSALSTM